MKPTDECYENLTDEQTSVEESVEQPKKKAGRPKGSGGLSNLKPFDHARSLAVQAKAAEARRARAEMRRKLLAAVCEEGIDKHVVKALKEANIDLMTCCEKAIKMTGLDFGSSEDAVQNLNVKADVDSKVKADYSLNINFTDATKGA